MPRRGDFLSDREKQVLLMLSQDKRLTTIGAELGISPGTVSGYVSMIKAKLHVRTTPGLIQRAHEEGYL